METVRLSGWKSQEGKSAYLAAYDSAMRLWPVPFESRQVATRFGSTHVVVSGSLESQPLVLLHAATGFGATQWYPNAAGISGRCRMYAVDFIGSAGKGTQTRPLLTRADCADWLADVIDALGLTRTDVVGGRLDRSDPTIDAIIHQAGADDAGLDRTTVDQGPVWRSSIRGR